MIAKEVTVVKGDLSKAVFRRSKYASGEKNRSILIEATPNLNIHCRLLPKTKFQPWLMFCVLLQCDDEQ